jgi:hypothetical protein
MTNPMLKFNTDIKDVPSPDFDGFSVPQCFSNPCAGLISYPLISVPTLIRYTCCFYPQFSFSDRNLYLKAVSNYTVEKKNLAYFFLLRKNGKSVLNF